MEPDPQASSIIWQKLLNLGEALLRQPDAASTCEYLNSLVQEQLNCQAFLWLSNLSIRCHGEPPVTTIPQLPTPYIVQKTLNRRNLFIQITKRYLNHHENANSIALPMITQGNLLGILAVDRPVVNHLQLKKYSRLQILFLLLRWQMQVNRQVALKQLAI
jgi:hypothetical protein